MLTLYHAPRSRSSRILWLLEEIGQPYRVEVVSVRRPDGSGGRDPRNPHPEGKVPVLAHDGQLVMESAAICLYLSDLYPAARVGPGPGDPRRGEYLTWLFGYHAVLEPAVIAKWKGTTETDAAEKESYDAMERRLRAALERGPYLLGDAFSTADVLVASIFQWGRHLMPQGEIFDAFVKRLSERPAFQRAAQKDDAPGS
jgi:glutathione S-transferase